MDKEPKKGRRMSNIRQKIKIWGVSVMAKGTVAEGTVHTNMGWRRSAIAFF
jgi:hypothetical protein